MKDLPRYDDFPDRRLSQFARDLLKSLDLVLDLNVYEVKSIVWAPGTQLSVPYANGRPRTDPPKIVRCVRAVSVESPSTPVHFGACSAQWLGNNQVALNDVDGLVDGHRYDLTFEVVS